MRGLGDFVGLMEGAALGEAFTMDGEDEGESKAGSGGGGGARTGGGGGGGGLKLELKDELGWISISGDGGGGNSGEVEQAGDGVRVGPCGVDGGAVPELEVGGNGGGKGGGGLRGVLGAEEEERS